MEDKANAGNTAVEAVGSKSTAAKRSSKTKAKQPKLARPSTSEMVNAAIKELKDRKGSSLQAIKKYIVVTYKVDAEKIAPFIKRYLKTAVSSGAVVQTKGKGASGSFKLSTDKPKPRAKLQRASKSKNRKVWVKKHATPKGLRKPNTPKITVKLTESKEQSTQKKSSTKSAGERKKRSIIETKALSKAKKAVKAPAAKTKAPKPKKAAAAKATKAAAKK